MINENPSSYYSYPRTPVSIFSPIINPTTTFFINSNRLKLAEFAGYIQPKSDIHSVRRFDEEELHLIDRSISFQRHYLLQISQESGTDMKNEVSPIS